MRQIAIKNQYWKREAKGFVFSPAKSVFLTFLLFVAMFCSGITLADKKSEKAESDLLNRINGQSLKGNR